MGNANNRCSAGVNIDDFGDYVSYRRTLTAQRLNLTKQSNKGRASTLPFFSTTN